MRALKHSSSLEGKVACSNVSVMVVFIAELETREQCGQSNITLAGRHQILVSDCISGKRPSFYSCISPLPSLTTALPTVACTA